MQKPTEGSPSVRSLRPTVPQSLSGCAFVFWTLTVTALMLLINAVLCLSIHSTIRSLAPAVFINNPKVANPISQLFYFIGPILLTVIQWSLLDRINRMFRSSGS